MTYDSIVVGIDPLKYAVSRSQVWVNIHKDYGPGSEDISALISYLRIFKDFGVEHGNISLIDGYARDFSKLGWYQRREKNKLKNKILSDLPPVIARAVEVLNHREKMDRINELQVRVDDAIKELENLRGYVMDLEETYEGKLAQFQSRVEGHPIPLESLLLDTDELSLAVWEEDRKIRDVLPMTRILHMEFKRRGMEDYASPLLRFYDYYRKKPGDKTFKQIKELGKELGTDEPEVDDLFHKLIKDIQIDLRKEITESRKSPQPILS